jgi:hypothetical protein
VRKFRKLLIMFVSCFVFLTVGHIQAMLSVPGSVRHFQVVSCTIERFSPASLGTEYM